MTEQAPYRIPARDAETEFVEKRSRFIGHVRHVSNEDEARSQIASIQKQHHDATHNVYAYIISPTLMRYSDDGEPQGTAGMPVLNVLQQEELREVCCVVTRYYGGILLGAGGLARAYSKAAKLALDTAGTLTMRLWDLLAFNCPYALFDPIKALVSQHGGIIKTTDFAADVSLAIYLPASEGPAFLKDIQTASSGSLCPRIVSTEIMAL